MATNDDVADWIAKMGQAYWICKTKLTTVGDMLTAPEVSK